MTLVKISAKINTSKLLGIKKKGGVILNISTRGRYGLKAMADMAITLNDAPLEKCISLKSIAERQGLSESYLEQLMSPLKKAGYIKSLRGARGGYYLLLPPEEITVGDILRVLEEGAVTPVRCISKTGEASFCGSSDCKMCVTKNVWEKLYNTLNEVVDNITLADLVEDYNEKLQLLNV